MSVYAYVWLCAMVSECACVRKCGHVLVVCEFCGGLSYGV